MLQFFNWCRMYSLCEFIYLRQCSQMKRTDDWEYSSGYGAEYQVSMRKSLNRIWRICETIYGESDSMDEARLSEVCADIKLSAFSSNRLNWSRSFFVGSVLLIVQSGNASTPLYGNESGDTMGVVDDNLEPRFIRTINRPDLLLYVTNRLLPVPGFDLPRPFFARSCFVVARSLGFGRADEDPFSCDSRRRKRPYSPLATFS